MFQYELLQRGTEQAISGMVLNNGHPQDNIHSTGQPDTPIECLEDILRQALQADPQQMRSLVEHAHKVAAGLDPYLDSISTPPSQVALRCNVTVMQFMTL